MLPALSDMFRKAIYHRSIYSIDTPTVNVIDNWHLFQALNQLIRKLWADCTSYTELTVNKDIGNKRLLCTVQYWAGWCFIYFPNRSSKAEKAMMIHAIVPSKGSQKFSIATVSHITDCNQPFQRQSENERFEAQFITPGTIGLDCSARSPPALCARARGACVVGVRRDESFQGHDKGSALGKILCYCGWISVQWAGWGSNTLG